MLCEFSAMSGSFLQTWALMSAIGSCFIFLTSAPTFYYYYWPSNVTYDKWRYKSNPKFPTPEKVRDEIVQMCKGILFSTVFPALSLELSKRGMSQAFCGWGDYSLSYHLATIGLSWILSDFFEFFYHRLGHTDFRFWQHHRHHHVFGNPSPFSVIADEPIDQLMRSLPLLLLPLMFPINMDVLFVQFGLFFYCYGVYLHCGYEHSFISPHHPVINSSFQHYVHHARSSVNTPYHCGFFFKIWDQIFRCCYPKEKPCLCAECARKNGERTEESWREVKIPDYSVLCKPSFWLTLETLKVRTKE